MTQATCSPVAICPKDIFKGISRLDYDQVTNLLKITYREADNRIDFSIKLHKSKYNNISSVQYVNRPIVQNSIVYPDYYLLTLSSNKIAIPKVGREVYDLMGQTGSAHAGEVIGFGCSVFHTTLQFVQIVASMLEDHNPSEDISQPSHLETTLFTIRDQFFEIDSSLHQRFHLATFQTIQLLEAITKEETLSYADYVVRNVPSQEISDLNYFKHTRDYLDSLSRKETPKFEEFLSRLKYLRDNFCDLYPTDAEKKNSIPSRYSFYDGRNVEICTEPNIKLPHNLRLFI